MTSEATPQFLDMPETPSIDDYKTLFGAYKETHSEFCYFNPNKNRPRQLFEICSIGTLEVPKYNPEAQQMLKIIAPVTINRYGHVCDRTTHLMGLIRAIIQESLLVDGKILYFHSRLYEKRVFFQVSKYDITVISAECSYRDRHPMTLFIFWLTMMAPKSPY